jgi:hypothetical protein
MLNPYLRTTSTTHPGSHPSAAVTGSDVQTEPNTLISGEGGPLEGASRDPTWHPGSRRSRQVDHTLRGLEPWPPLSGVVSGIDHARMAPNASGSARSASARSRCSKDTATALQWLRKGAPIDDVRTVVEVRRRFELSPELARRYAANIVLAAVKVLRAERSNSTKEEITHAVA